MKKMWSAIKYKPIISTLILLLVTSFLLLSLFPFANLALYELDWFIGYTGLTQYYVNLLCSIMIFIVGFSLNEILKNDYTGRSVLLSTGFFALSLFLFINSLAFPLPYFAFTTNIQNVSEGALQSGLFFSGIIFVLAGTSFASAWQTKLIKYRLWLWLSILLITAVYLIFRFANILQYTPSIFTTLQNVLTVIFLSIASWQSWQLWLKNNVDFDYKIGVTFLLFAFVDLILLVSSSWLLSWSLHLLTLLLASSIAITAVLGLLKASSDVPLVRYFAILGITLIITFSIANVEIGVTWIPGAVQRIWLVPFVLMQGALTFIVLLFVVMYLNRLIKHRTDALRQEQYQRSELTQLIVHDLKSPLTVILSGMNLLAHENLGSLNPTQQKLLSSLEKSGQDVLSMINDLLDVEKLEEGKLQLVQSSFDPIDLIQGRVDELNIVASTHKQTLSFSHMPPHALIRADRRLIQRVINNLLTNALKFTPEAGKIHITLESENNNIIIKIADSGPGVPQNDRQHIFEKFAQLKGNERRGAGLGLTFCKMVTEAHQGTLTVEDSPLGGALFKLALPKWEDPTDKFSFSAVNDLSLANAP